MKIDRCSRLFLYAQRPFKRASTSLLRHFPQQASLGDTIWRERLALLLWTTLRSFVTDSSLTSLPSNHQNSTTPSSFLSRLWRRFQLYATPGSSQFFFYSYVCGLFRLFIHFQPADVESFSEKMMRTEPRWARIRRTLASLPLTHIYIHVYTRGATD